MNFYAKEAMKFIDGVPDGLEMVNLGSTFSKFGFDYKHFGKKGFNFAVQPQPLIYDYKILKQYASKLNKGALVVVVVCLFGFAVDYYHSDASNFKYYFFLDKREIHRYSKVKNFFVKYLPFFMQTLHSGILKRVIFKVFLICGVIRDKNNTHKDPRINGWMCEFNLKNMTDGRQAEKLSNVFANTIDSLKKILDMCREYEFRPVIINMPAVKSQSDEFSDEFIDNFYTVNVQQANLCGTPVINYFRDERFDDSSLYENGTDCLNDKGRKLFAEILTDDLKKIGLSEE